MFNKRPIRLDGGDDRRCDSVFITARRTKLLHIRQCRSWSNAGPCPITTDGRRETSKLCPVPDWIHILPLVHFRVLPRIKNAREVSFVTHLNIG